MFWRLALATFSRLDSVTKIACFAKKKCQFLKLFNFPSNFCDFSLSSLPETLSNSPCHSQTNFHFYIISTQNLQEKGMGFPFLSTYFMFWVLFYLNLWVVGLIWDSCCFSNGLDEFLVCLDFCVLIFNLLGLYSFAFMVDIDWVCLLICLELESHTHCVMIFLLQCTLCVFLVDSKWLCLVGWDICLNCFWLSCVLILSCGYCLLCVGLNNSYSLWHIS